MVAATMSVIIIVNMIYRSSTRLLFVQLQFQIVRNHRMSSNKGHCYHYNHHMGYHKQRRSHYAAHCYCNTLLSCNTLFPYLVAPHSAHQSTTQGTYDYRSTWGQLRTCRSRVGSYKCHGDCTNWVRSIGRSRTRPSTHRRPTARPA